MPIIGAVEQSTVTAPGGATGGAVTVGVSVQVTVSAPGVGQLVLDVDGSLDAVRSRTRLVPLDTLYPSNTLFPDETLTGNGLSVLGASVLGVLR